MNKNKKIRLGKMKIRRGGEEKKKKCILYSVYA